MFVCAPRRCVVCGGGGKKLGWMWEGECLHFLRHSGAALVCGRSCVGWLMVGVRVLWLL